MWLCVLLFVVVVVIIYEVLPILRKNYAEAKANKAESAASQESFKKAKKAILIGIVALIVSVIIGILCFIGYANSEANSNRSKGKCSWCGKETQLTGSFCSSCNNKAFGEDGWYNKIKD